MSCDRVKYLEAGKITVRFLSVPKTSIPPIWQKIQITKNPWVCNLLVYDACHYKGACKMFPDVDWLSKTYSSQRWVFWMAGANKRIKDKWIRIKTAKCQFFLECYLFIVKILTRFHLIYHDDLCNIQNHHDCAYLRHNLRA